MARRARGPILAVLVTSVLLLAGARLIGRAAASREAGRGGKASTPQQAALDLSFYSVLGDAAPRSKGSESALRAAPGDLVPEKGIYVVQVLGSADEAQAKRMKDRLAVKGFQASSLQDPASGAWQA